MPELPPAVAEVADLRPVLSPPLPLQGRFAAFESPGLSEATGVGGHAPPWLGISSPREKAEALGAPHPEDRTLA